MATIEQRFKVAVRRLRDAGITATVIFDDRGFVTSEYLEAYRLQARRAGTGNRWVGAAKPGARWFGDGRLGYADALVGCREVAELRFDHEHTDPSTAQALVEAMHAEGFGASWSGIAKDCVVVRLT